MAELKRTEENLTTAHLARRNEAEKEVRRDTERRGDGPQLVPGEHAESRAVAGSEPKLKDNTAGQTTPLFSETDVNDLRSRWSGVQAGFVDEPRRALEEADKLVASVMKRLAEAFANERANLEKQWERGDSASTEDLRVALQRYRSFFDRLLKA